MRDIALIYENSMIYNRPDTVYYKSAAKLEQLCVNMIVELEECVSDLKIVNGIWDTELTQEFLNNK